MLLEVELEIAEAVEHGFVVLVAEMLVGVGLVIVVVAVGWM